MSDRLTKFMFLLWAVLATAGFVGAFWVAPGIVRTLEIIFGILNMSVIFSWISALRQARKEYKKNKIVEE